MRARGISPAASRFLVDGPLHCGACHTGKTWLGADIEDEYLHGGLLDNWFAPNIRGGENGGIAHWEVEDIVGFLGTGQSRHAVPMQRMGEVVAISTQNLREADLRAVAVYLKSLDDAVREEHDPPETARTGRKADRYGTAVHSNGRDALCWRRDKAPCDRGGPASKLPSAPMTCRLLALRACPEMPQGASGGSACGGEFSHCITALGL